MSAQLHTPIPMCTPFAQTFFHGTIDDLKIGDLIQIGNSSNFGQNRLAKYIYLSGTLDAAIWGAEPSFKLKTNYNIRGRQLVFNK